MGNKYITQSELISREHSFIDDVLRNTIALRSHRFSVNKYFDIDENLKHLIMRKCRHDFVVHLDDLGLIKACLGHHQA